jgi:hypothetical protein
VCEPPPPPETDEEDDFTVVLESIELMMQLKGLSPESRRDLAQIRARAERFKSGQPWK